MRQADITNFTHSGKIVEIFGVMTHNEEFILRQWAGLIELTLDFGVKGVFTKLRFCEENEHNRKNYFLDFEKLSMNIYDIGDGFIPICQQAKEKIKVKEFLTKIGR